LATAKLFLVACFVFPSLILSFEVFAEKPARGFFFLKEGFSGNSVGSNKESFNQYKSSLTLMLPWQWQLPASYWIKTGIDFTAGILSGGGDNTFVGSAGPRVSFRTPEETFALDIGLAPTYVDRHELGETDVGGALQFTSFIGLYTHFLDRYRLKYRFQHMSNAGIHSQNDSVNMHMFEVGFLF
jgi:Lipid A 3-O-deacylase (PagL)